ncbi:MAG: serine hydrolase [Saprospiraceae bacterium]|nr:serine hydrolase [Saprospiraceae bacterium]
MQLTKKHKKIVLITIAVIVIALVFLCLYKIYFNKAKQLEFGSPFLNIKSAWVDSLVENMSLDEKIGQLIIIEQSKANNDDIELLKQWIQNYGIGGLRFETDSLKKQMQSINEFQALSKVPLLIQMQTAEAYAEFLKDIVQLPKGNTIDAISNDSLLDIYRNIIVQQNKLLGIHANLSIPISNNRDSVYFLRKTKKLCLELQQQNILAGINNFEMFSNIEDDTSANYLKYIQPYKNLIINGLSCIHSNYNKSNSIFLKDYLKKGLNFQGLSLIQANSCDAGEALLSGADALIVNDSIDFVFEKIKKLIDKDEISIKQIDNKVRRILSAKSWTGLENYKEIDIEKSEKIIRRDFSELFKRNLIEFSITIVRNKNKSIPFKNLKDKKFTIANFGKSNISAFVEYFQFYDSVSVKNYAKNTSKFLNFAKNKNDSSTIILTFNNFKLDSSKHRKFLLKLKKLDTLQNIVIVNFNNPENLKHFQNLSTVVQLYDNAKIEQEFASQLLFGGISAKGILPFKISDSLHYGSGEKTKKVRLKYTIPEDAGLNDSILSQIDSIAKEAIELYAFPGCQVWVAKDGKVIYNKAFGYHTYDKKTKVKTTDLYDIASVTKVAATTIAAMKMYDDKKLNLFSNLEEYFKNTKINYTRIKPDTIINIDTLKLREIENIDTFLTKWDTIQLNDSMLIAYDTIYFKVTPKLNIFKSKPYNLLMHKSGLSPSLPILSFLYYRRDTVVDTTLPLKNRKDTVAYLFNKYYGRSYIKDSITVKIANNFYLKDHWFDSLWVLTKQIRLCSNPVYQYSDINMIMLQQTIDTINQMSIDKYMEKYFYQPLGLQTICYHPLKKFDKSRITPTAIDEYWRQQLIHGYVHDPSAAILGGISGNAGVFTNASDLGVLFEMLRNNGIYGGEKYLNSETVKRFTSTQPGSHRGLGFDKNSSFMAESASSNTYGHTGFTGTCVWVDPDNNLVYVFLSNRVNPSVKNWKLNTYAIRQRIHQVIYDAMEK